MVRGYHEVRDVVRGYHEVRETGSEGITRSERRGQRVS